MENKPTIRMIYLYIFAMLGLVLIVIGGVRFLDMGLKAFIFTQADAEQRIMNKMPPYTSISVEKYATQAEAGEKIEVTAEEKAMIVQWNRDYKNWQESSAKIDYVTSNRQRSASLNLALIIIGLPLYLYHWGIIKKETKAKT
ncbi:MAG: hypothetical protein Q8O03_00275 [Nanoarchaeota archaeon]|nr:hypothetical protein [Nanoarchaeota archaeon]